MTLAPGERLAHFEILASIGKGGMGEVYKARDTRLGRDVAIKVSAERFSDRFDREARTIASLNHPNICALYDVGPNYLVMELVDGESPEGPLPVSTVVDYARQMADALDAAHEKGITHRDLKPANLKITPDGKVKVLDFGLAKFASPPEGGHYVPDGRSVRLQPDLSMSPTITTPAMTQAGMILGTAAYMAPEQARGRPVDKRADIWAFGVVLYELATGKPLFKGDDVTDVLASVLRDQPNIDALPPQLTTLVRRCLEKDPKRRLRDIADAAALLDLPAVAAAPQEVQAKRVAWMPWAVAATLGAAAMTFAGLWLQPDPLPEVTRFQIHAPPGLTLSLGTPAVSPDGRAIAYVASDDKRQTRIYLQRLDRDGATPLPGTENAIHPFWSPDGRALAFAAENVLKRIDIDGGAARTVSEIQGPWHGDWNDAGDILVQMSDGIRRLSARSSGGATLALGESPFAVGHPAFLPDGARFLFRDSTGDDPVIRLASLDNPQGDGPVVLAADSAPLLGRTPAGAFLLYLQEPDLMAVAFDDRAGTTAGDPVVLVPNVGRVANPPVKPTAGVSRNGVLAFQGGGFEAGSLRWVDRAGQAQGSIPLEGAAQWLRLSPDGSMAATRQNGDFWVTDLTRGTTTRLTSDGRYNGGAWSPDGKQIAFGRRAEFRAVNVDGSGEARLGSGAGLANLTSWTTKGLALRNEDGVWMTAVGATAPPARIAPAGPNDVALAPDGRFVAYRARSGSRNEVFIQAMPPDTGRIQVSINGGNQPRWRGDSKELFFADPGRSTVLAVDILPGDTPKAGVPHELFGVAGLGQAWDVSPDGKRFLMWTSSGAQTDNPITVVQNWWVDLKK